VDIDKLLIVSETETNPDSEKDAKTNCLLEKQPLSLNSHNLEDLVSKTKSIERLTSEFTDKCFLCGFNGRMDWRVTLFDDSWGLLCGSCGDKVAERLKPNG
jgi:hypothetical protein